MGDFRGISYGYPHNPNGHSSFGAIQVGAYGRYHDPYDEKAHKSQCVYTAHMTDINGGIWQNNYQHDQSNFSGGGPVQCIPCWNRAPHVSIPLRKKLGETCCLCKKQINY